MTEDLLAQERAAEQKVHYLLKNRDEPVLNLLQALEEYRGVCVQSIFSDFENGAEKVAVRLWQVHTEGKRYFQRALSGLRKQSDAAPVALRTLVKLFLQFIKDSQRCYREIILKLAATFGGIPELEAVAHQVKPVGSGESAHSQVSPELRQKVLDSCHQALIYLGDLSRYRASEHLDKSPDFGPAIGYYGLACTLRPTSGMGHHQQAVIALEQRQHLRAVYHLYRAIVVEDPHPNAANNLKLEFDKTDTAWQRGELIRKGAPNDPEATKIMLIGLFIRLHSICYQGAPFRGYDELELGVLDKLAQEIKNRDFQSTLLRLVMINLAAQFEAAERFQKDPSQSNQDAVLHFLRFNVNTFSAVLRVFSEAIRAVDVVNPEIDSEDVEVFLGLKLSVVARRTLPTLRLYSTWLLPMVRLFAGVAAYALLKDAVSTFWPLYAEVVDLIAVEFPIWDLDELPALHYLLEEDVETLGFRPLIDDKTTHLWSGRSSKSTKPRYFDADVVRTSTDAEMLARVKYFLATGVSLATDDSDAPIKLRGTRILHQDAADPEEPPVSLRQNLPTEAQVLMPKSDQKPLSYAAAAAAKPTRNDSPQTILNGSVPFGHVQSRDAQLSRMVDDLVEDDEDDENPLTPPQQHSASPRNLAEGTSPPTVVPDSAPDFPRFRNYAYLPKIDAAGTVPGVVSPPTTRAPRPAALATPTSRATVVSELWEQDLGTHASISMHTPSGLPTRSLGSPVQVTSCAHSRVNSASSNRSLTSASIEKGIVDSWSSLEPRLPKPSTPHARATQGASVDPAIASPLLFGAGGSLWSTHPRDTYKTVSPPTGLSD